MSLRSLTALAVLLVNYSSQAFQVLPSPRQTRSLPSGVKSRLYLSTTNNEGTSTGAGTGTTSILDRIEGAKEDLVRLCSSNDSSTKPPLEVVRAKVQTLEELAEQGGIGQASGHSGLISGEW